MGPFHSEDVSQARGLQSATASNHFDPQAGAKIRRAERGRSEPRSGGAGPSAWLTERTVLDGRRRGLSVQRDYAGVDEREDPRRIEPIEPATDSEGISSGAPTGIISPSGAQTPIEFVSLSQRRTLARKAKDFDWERGDLDNRVKSVESDNRHLHKSSLSKTKARVKILV